MPLLQVSKKYKPYYQRNTTGKRILLIIRILTGWFLLYQFVTVFLVSSYSVDSVSMRPGVDSGDRILVSRIEYGPILPFSTKRLPGIRKPVRGDIVVLEPPYYRDKPLAEKTIGPLVRFFTFNRVNPEFRYRESWERSLIIKRILGIPGDTIRIKGQIVFIQPAGSTQFMSEFDLVGTILNADDKDSHPGWDPTLPFSGDVEDLTLGSDEYYVLGDNRSDSSDSRYWGPVRFDDIKGRVVFRYFPFGKMSAP